MLSKIGGWFTLGRIFYEWMDICQHVNVISVVRATVLCLRFAKIP